MASYFGIFRSQPFDRLFINMDSSSLIPEAERRPGIRHGKWRASRHLAFQFPRVTVFVSIWVWGRIMSPEHRLGNSLDEIPRPRRLLRLTSGLWFTSHRQGDGYLSLHSVTAYRNHSFDPSPGNDKVETCYSAWPLGYRIKFHFPFNNINP